jgi:AP2 domain
MEQHDLPQGVWFEPERNRFRVRLYRGRHVWLKYFRSVEEAKQYRDALLQQIISGEAVREKERLSPLATMTIKLARSIPKSA